MSWEPGIAMRMLWTYCMWLLSMISWPFTGFTERAPGCAMITYPVGFYREKGKLGKLFRRFEQPRGSCRFCRGREPSRSTSRLSLIVETWKPTEPIIFLEGVS